MRWDCPSDRLLEARQTVEASFAPAPPEEIMKALYVMRRMTRGRDGEMRDEEAGEVEIHAWVRQLADYPADVVLSCLQDWPKSSSYWPTWHEIRQRLDKGTSQRRVMRHIIEQQIRAQGGLQQMRLNASEETPERRAEVVDRLLGDLARDTGMTFKADKRREDLVAGRVKAGTEAKERAAAERRLEELKADTSGSTFTLSELAKKAFGIPTK